MTRKGQKSHNLKFQSEERHIQTTEFEVLTHPKRLNELKDVAPDIPDRILSLLENQQVHRQGMEKLSLESEIKISMRAQIIACILFGASLIFSFYLMYINNPNGIYLIMIMCIAICVFFITNKISKLRQLRINKNEIDIKSK